MNKFPIYIPKIFYPSRTLIFYLIIVALLSASFITQEINGSYEGSIFKLLLISAFGIFLLGMLLGLLGIGKTKPLYGDIVGEISFFKTEIKVDKLTIPLENITKIEIIGTDWLGLFNKFQHFSFENALSNGSQNWLILHLESSTLKVRFQQHEACQFSRIKEEFLGYYELGKITYLNLIDILCITDPDEQATIKLKIGTTNNCC